jgi:hypothetical protein
MKKKKQSIVLFEDWIKYARCLTDNEFRQFVNAIFEYYEGILPEFTDNLKLVWEDCIPDLEQNVEKLNKKRVTMKSNARTNPKLNITPETRPDIGPEIEPNIVPDSSGMVDGRWEMGDEGWEMEDKGCKIVDRKTGYDDRGNYVIEDTLRCNQNSLLTKEYITSELNKGISPESLMARFPTSSSFITDIYLDFES